MNGIYVLTVYVNDLLHNVMLFSVKLLIFQLEQKHLSTIEKGRISRIFLKIILHVSLSPCALLKWHVGVRCFTDAEVGGDQAI